MREILFCKTDNGELRVKAVVSQMETTAAEDKRYSTNYCNQDVSIAVGYCTNSKKTTMFWLQSTGRKSNMFVTVQGLFELLHMFCIWINHL